jgi:hypothetical protein
MLRLWLGKSLLLVWFGGMVLVGAGLLARHLVALPAPTPTQYDRLSRGLTALRGATDGRWSAFHVLAEECRCSAQVVEHLLTTPRPEGWVERVLWIGNAPPRELTQRFDVHTARPADLARLGIESAPLLIAMTPEGSVRYAGGYTDSKQGPVNHDLEILAAVRAQAAPSPLPLFGCAVSDRLKALLRRLPTG